MHSDTFRAEDAERSAFPGAYPPRPETHRAPWGVLAGSPPGVPADAPPQGDLHAPGGSEERPRPTHGHTLCRSPCVRDDDPPSRRVETAAERLAAACRAPGARRQRAHGRRDAAAEEGKTGRWSGLTDEPAEHGVGVREPTAFLHASNAQLKTKVKNTQQWHRKNKILKNKDT